MNNSQFMPLAATPTVSGKAPVSPTPPTTNACLSCHNTEPAWSHAIANTNQYGESCPVCHDDNSQYSVSRVHAQ